MELSVRRESGKLRPVKSLNHALDVLELLAEEGQPELGVSELARRVGLSKTTVHQILGTLETRGCVLQNQHTGRYRLGWRLFELGRAVTRRVELVALAQPYLAVLSRETNESVQLGVLASSEVLYVAKHEPPRSVVIAAAVGRRLPLHATAAGKVLMAWSAPEKIAEMLKGPFQPYTPQTITNPSQLRAEVQRVRQQGYGICLTEYENDVNALAAPVFNFTGQCVAVISLAGPAVRFVEATMDRCRPNLLAAVGALSRELGYGTVSTETRG